MSPNVAQISFSPCGGTSAACKVSPESSDIRSSLFLSVTVKAVANEQPRAAAPTYRWLVIQKRRGYALGITGLNALNAKCQVLSAECRLLSRRPTAIDQHGMPGDQRGRVRS